MKSYFIILASALFIAVTTVTLTACKYSNVSHSTTNNTTFVYDSSMFPNWQEADEVLGVSSRGTDAWCDLASNNP